MTEPTDDDPEIFDANGHHFDIVAEKNGWWSATPSDMHGWIAWRQARKFPGTVEQFMSVAPRRGFPLGQIRRKSLEELRADILQIMEGV